MESRGSVVSELAAEFIEGFHYWLTLAAYVVNHTVSYRNAVEGLRGLARGRGLGEDAIDMVVESFDEEIQLIVEFNELKKKPKVPQAIGQRKISQEWGARHGRF